MNRPAMLHLLQASFPDLLAVYAFGSQVNGTAGPESDLDLAVLVPGQANPLQLWEIAGKIADVAGCPVDLLDFRAASTVMQYRILSTGQRWWVKDGRADLYEAGVLSDKTELDCARQSPPNDEFLEQLSGKIERWVRRAREEYAADPAGFANNFSRQDAAILNIQRACEAALDLGQHLIRRERLGVPQSARDVFALLAQGGWITPTLADQMKPMVGFRNIAVHDYASLQLPIIVRIIETHLDEFLDYAQTLLRKSAGDLQG